MFNPFWDYSDPEPILREVFPDPINAQPMNLFGYIGNAWRPAGSMDAPPWTGYVTPQTLDIEYILNHSGGKFCSPLIKELLSRGDTYAVDGVLTGTSLALIAKVIVGKYKQNWQRLWDVNVASYNPINNYDMVETRKTRGASSEAKVSKTDRMDEETETNEYGKTETVEHGRTSDSMSYRYGINTDTSDPKPSEKDTMEEGGATITRDGGSDTAVRELANGSDSTSNSVGATEEEEELHRSGNIGVTTTQKMIEEERRLWIWNYFDQVFSDLDQVLVLSFHDPCRV